MEDGIKRRLKDVKVVRFLNQCKKFKDFIVYNDILDIMLGIGKVQIFATTTTKKRWLKIENLIFKVTPHNFF